MVSLAAALSIPLLANGQPFPQRNLILFITFVVILVTLVFQGLSLPVLIRLTRLDELEEPVPPEEQEAGVRLRLRKAAIAHLKQQYAEETRANMLIGRLQQRMETEVQLTAHTLESLEFDERQRAALHQYHRVLLDVLRVQRAELFEMRRHNTFDDEVLRQQEAQARPGRGQSPAH
ncbi:hypothetical protein ACFQT0_12085 [Hymenobacter humi]|uniref:Na+/H+ antiporter n=1 Tax=Hymenobacter humi TaxID=1411620 RepID=A0ABW2U3U3_9BACT